MVMTAGAVVVVRVAVDHFGLRRGAAAVDRWAIGDFYLDGGVVDAKVVAQLMIHAGQDGFAGGEVHLDDLYVAGERVALGAEAPNVQIMYVDHAFDLRHCRPNLAHVQVLRGALEQDVQAFRARCRRNSTGSCRR